MTLAVAEGFAEVGGLTVRKAQAIACRSDGGAGRFEYVLVLDLRGPQGVTTRVAHRWQADDGWEALSRAAASLAGKSWPVAAKDPTRPVADLARAAATAGLLDGEVERLSETLKRAILVMASGGVRAEQLEYSDILDRVTQYGCYPAPSRPKWNGQPANIYDEVGILAHLGNNATNGHLLERHSLAYGLNTTRFSPGTFLASDGVREPLNFRWSRSPISSGVALALCTHKDAVRAHLARAGVPVPRGRAFRNGELEAALGYAALIGYPVVCKPATGVRGIGVVANIQTEEELRDAFLVMSQSKLGGDDFIIEKHIHGHDYRILVIGREVVAAILRQPASVTGDGEGNIAELILQRNLIRGTNPHLRSRLVRFGPALQYQLARQGLTLDAVPEPGRTVMLSNSSSLSQGGDSIDISDELHATVRRSAVAAVEAIPGLNYCGVDYLMEDHTRPIDEQSAGICELNAHATIGNCEFPMFGKPREVSKAFFIDCANAGGLKLRDQPAERLAVRVVVRGKVTGVGYRNWLKAQADSFGVKGWVRNTERRAVEAVLIGDTASVSALAMAAVTGPSGAQPTSVHTEHVAETGETEFKIQDISGSIGELQPIDDLQPTDDPEATGTAEQALSGHAIADGLDEAVVGRGIASVEKYSDQAIRNLELPAILRDGFEVQRAALSRGLNVTLYPRQVMLAAVPGRDAAQLSFVHGIPAACTLSGLSYAQDRRVARGLMQRAGLPVVRGATFSFRRLDRARSYAARLRFPVVVREGFGEYVGGSIYNVASLDTLDKAVAEIRALPGLRSRAASSLVRSAYGRTALQDMPEGPDGMEIAAPATRFLIEQQPEGEYLRCFVLDGVVEAILMQPGGPSSRHGDHDGTKPQILNLAPRRPLLFRHRVWKGVHPDLVEIASGAQRAIPGLKMAVVSIATQNHRVSPRFAGCWIVDLSERPGLSQFAEADDALAVYLADRMLAYEAERVAADLRPVADLVSVSLQVDGVADTSAFAARLNSALDTFGIRGSVRLDSGVEPTVTADADGSPAAIARLVEIVMAGGLGGDWPRRLDVTHRAA